VANDTANVLSELDIIYLNSIAYLGDGYRELSHSFRLTKDSPLKKDALILHSLSRKSELDVSLDDTKHNLYFNQADGAVFVRQALLLTILGRLHLLPDVKL
jgi:aspartate carbamoyltransferase catalytic subunit